MTLEGSTIVPTDSFGSSHSYNFPTNSFSTQNFSCGDLLKNSIAGAMALVSLGVSPVVLESPTNRIIGHSRYTQTVRNDYQVNFSSYIVENEQAVYKYINTCHEVAVFLENIAAVIQRYFGSAHIILDAWTSPVDYMTKLYLTVKSGIDDEDLLMDKEVSLFNEIEGNILLQEGLAHVVIAVR